MNYLLSLNKKYLVIIISLVIILGVFVFIYQTINISLLKKESISFQISNSDITKPKFTINSESQKISISANEGNFINNEEILLKNDVVFKSDKFTIYSDDVIFNKDEQTAKSLQESKFISKNTSISSNGFEIIDEGNKINFKGKTVIKLK